jgi:hypothetical protein
MKSTILALATVAACLMLHSPIAPAEEAQPHLVRSFVMVAKPGADDALSKALKSHGEWRAKNGDTWDWFIYTRVAGVGPMATYVVRSGPQRFADFEAYTEFGLKALPHFNQTVGPHLAHNEAHIQRWAPDISHWPEDAGPYSMFWVYEYQLRPGGSDAAMAALKEIARRLREANSPLVYAWEMNLTGPPALTLVLPAADWSGFESPARSATEVLAPAIGEQAARELWGAFTAQVESLDSSIWVELPELRVETKR